MQTLRKRTSPCKYKNDPSRFLGEGITFKAKLIGILEVSEPRGDKMCQDALNDLKTAIRAAGEHKQRITISISIEGLKLRDEKTGDCLYHHPVHKISFIAQDMTDARAFGYIFGSPDIGHRFFGIKTDKTSSQVVISMRDLFQVVFELKKKEIEMAKHHSEQHFIKYGNLGYIESLHFSKDESEVEKGKGKYSQLLKSRCLTSKPSESSSTDYKVPTSEAIADLLDLEHELNNIQQGINQMDKITPSDPFGPLTKGESYIDPFDDSFSAKSKKPLEEKISSSIKSQGSSHHSDDASDQEKRSSFLGPTTSCSKTSFFSQFSPGIGKSKADDTRWFDQEAESLFNDTANINDAEPTSSPVALNPPAPESDQGEGKKSPIKTDLFTELDPLGTGRVKPYIDKKDFFQELKNPPKKVLKELITEGSTSETTKSFYFPANFKDEKTPSTTKSDSAQPSSTIDSVQALSSTPKYGKIDPFEDNDPFDKTDPFQEETFSTSAGFSSLLGSKPICDKIFDDTLSWKFEAKCTEDDGRKNSPTNFALIPSSTLRVSLPPEKSDETGSHSPISSNTKSPSNSSENSERKNYDMLKQTTQEESDDGQIKEEIFVSCKVMNVVLKPEQEKKSFKEKFYSLRSPPFSQNEKSKTQSIVDYPEEKTPEPPPRAKSSLFSIKPPPLPPKKSSQCKPPPRPPSLEDNTFHYDCLEKKENYYKEELKCVKLKKELLSGKNLPPATELKKQNSNTHIPLIPPPPQRKTLVEGSKVNTGRKSDSKTSETAGSILNIKLNQLDNTGLENLAITLGIPSENIYSMTLQELTKMLAEKYLISEIKTKKPVSDSFEVDFDSNFAKVEPSSSNMSSSYDKYAVFKELMENESKSTAFQNVLTDKSTDSKEADLVKEENIIKESEKQEEDKYAALRQLSLNVQKSDDFGEDLCVEDNDKKEKCVTSVNQTSKDVSSSAVNNLDLPPDILDINTKWSTESKNENLQTNTVDCITEKIKYSDQEEPKTEPFPSESSLFPLADQFHSDKKSNAQKDNWTTFEKSDFEETTERKSSNTFNENENSPFSSDGKEDVREIPFHWHQNASRKKARDVPWQDDDESWDDYSPKESFCSDESSHEDRSPDPRRFDRYEKPSWNLCERPPKTDRNWNGKGNQWSQRDKWNEETEDEFEETWRKQKERTSPYESDRKANFWYNTYDSCNCYNSRNEPWEENERHVHYYMNRRQRSESDNEYRKRCDSDTSDKECIWTFQKNYPDSLGRSNKQKQYYSSGHTFRDCAEHCHESRSKHRRGVSQKRPSSVSEAKRNYEKMCSPDFSCRSSEKMCSPDFSCRSSEKMCSPDFSCRSSEKNYPSKMDKEEYFRYQYNRKDFRHRGDADFYFYGPSEKRISGQHSKMGSRSSRGSTSEQSDKYPSPVKNKESIEIKNHDFDYFEPFKENFKPKKPENTGHFHFDSEAKNYEKTLKCVPDQSPQDFPRTFERKPNQWTSTNGKTNNEGFFFERNINENFAKFHEDLKTSPKKSSDNGKLKGTQEATRSEAKTKPHLAMLQKQESSATLRKSDSINIFSRDKDPFEGDDFFTNVS